MDRDLVRFEEVEDEAADEAGTFVDGTAYQISEAAYNSKMLRTRVPRQYWDIGRNDVGFKPFRAGKNGFHFTSAQQQQAYQQWLDVIAGKNPDHDVSSYNDFMFCAASNPTDHLATCLAASLVGAYIRAFWSFKGVWCDANESTKWGRNVAPDPTETKPHLIVVTGVYPDPTKELRESVRRWFDYARRPPHLCPLILVGAGQNPLDLLQTWYHIKPSGVFYTSGKVKRSTTVG